MDEYDQTLEKYKNKLIILIKPQTSGQKVLQDKYLLLNIFSYFKSGWIITENNYHSIDRQYCFYKDIFQNNIKIHQVTRTINNPYKNDSVSKKIGDLSFYVGPLNEWYKTYKTYNRKYLKK
jgi:hypothetical protein